jgi:catechol 2,3-dioxygenase-like lactoylglutathione lyase family enzyme/ferredoxin
MPQITQKSTKPPLLKLNFISHATLEVSDLQASRRFYEEVMGFEVLQRTPVSLLLRLGSDHTYVVVETRQPKGMGLFNHNGVDVSTGDDVQAAYDALIAVQNEYGIQRLEKPCWQHGVFAFFFADPDGNWWEILANPPRGYAPEFDEPEADLTGRTDLTEDEVRGASPLVKNPPRVTAPTTVATPGRPISGFEVVVERDRCMGTGNCAFWLPTVFQLDDEGYAVVADPRGAPEPEIITAAQRCPIHAISVRRDGQTLV